MTAWPTVGATGHRPQHLNHLSGANVWAQQEAARVAGKLRDEHGCTTAISGAAIGFDTWWAQAALDAGLHLWLHVPFEGQPDRWTRSDQQAWARLRAAATKETVYSSTNPRDSREASRLLFARNHGMITASDAMTCLWDPAKRQGGTFHAVRRIAKTGMPAIHLNPAARTVRCGLPSNIIGGTCK